MSLLVEYSWMLQLLVVAPLFILAIVVHEQSHYKMLQYYNIIIDRPRFALKKKILPTFSITLYWPKGSLTTEQEKDVYFAGIFGGLFILLFIMLLVDVRLSLLLLLLYFAGCKHDIKELLKRNKRVKK